MSRPIHIAFDLDGTLIDSVGDLASSASELVTSLGGRALDQSEVAAMVGEGANILVQRALARAGLDTHTPGALQQFLTIYHRRMLETTVPYDGIEDVLLHASGRAGLSVLTNKPLPASRRILDALGLTRYFVHILGGDGPHARKPDPAGLRLLGSGSKTVVLVGDSPIDWETAIAAGCTFVWARYGFGAARFDARPDTPFVLERPSDFVAALDRIVQSNSTT